MGAASSGETTSRPEVLNGGGGVGVILFPTPGHLAMSREIFFFGCHSWLGVVTSI